MMLSGYGQLGIGVCLTSLFGMAIMLHTVPASAADAVFGDVIVSEVTSIYDADNFTVNIKSWPDIVGHHIPVRIKGIDAPEMSGQCAVEKFKARDAKQFAVAKLRDAKVIELRNIQRDKYFRLLADVYVDENNLAAALLKEGLVREYSGDKKNTWCDSD